MAKELARQGHDVTILTTDKGFDYSEFKRQYSIEIISYGILTLKPLNRSAWRLIGDWKRKLGRMLFFLCDYPNIEIMFRLQEALRNEADYDLMISIAVPYPVYWGTAWARSAGNPVARTWVADCGDPFMGNTLESFRYPFYLGYLEKWFSRKADFISIPVRTAVDAYYPEFHHKIRIIPQGFSFASIPQERMTSST